MTTGRTDKSTRDHAGHSRPPLTTEQINQLASTTAHAYQFLTIIAPQYAGNFTVGMASWLFVGWAVDKHPEKVSAAYADLVHQVISGDTDKLGDDTHKQMIELAKRKDGVGGFASFVHFAVHEVAEAGQAMERNFRPGLEGTILRSALATAARGLALVVTLTNDTSLVSEYIKFLVDNPESHDVLDTYALDHQGNRLFDKDKDAGPSQEIH